jgi:hypothetical protein
MSIDSSILPILLTSATIPPLGSELGRVWRLLVPQHPLLGRDLGSLRCSIHLIRSVDIWAPQVVSLANGNTNILGLSNDRH